MTFLSVFWLAIMAGVTLLFWLIPARHRFTFLIAATVAFLGYVDWKSLLLLTAMTAVTYLFTRRANVTGRAVATGSAIIGATLIAFKFAHGEAAGDTGLDFAIPLGMSYYALRCIHYMLERYKRAIPQTELSDLASYLYFLPTIFIGPIHRYPSLHPRYSPPPLGQRHLLGRRSKDHLRLYQDHPTGRLRSPGG